MLKFGNFSSTHYVVIFIIRTGKSYRDILVDRNSKNKLTVKRIITHALFWAFYVLFFGTIYGKYGHDYRWYLMESTCMLPFLMIATYTTIYGILPFYLKYKKPIIAVFLIITLLFLVTLGERIVVRKLNALPVTLDSLFGVNFLNLMLETNFMVAIAFAIKFVKKWFEQQQEKHEIEKKNLESELNLLKAQLHPHFLFNTMNNLYALSLEKSTKTSEGIARISDLLRSVLYDCNELEIALEKEISLIQNYIDLEKMRYGNRLDIEFNVNGSIENVKIAPMMLFTFVENSFKHGSSNDPEQPYIHINLDVSPNKLLFMADNSKPNGEKIVNEDQVGGIGLNNVKKRLELIYKGKYELAYGDDNNCYKVRLLISR